VQTSAFSQEDAVFGYAFQKKDGLIESAGLDMNYKVTIDTVPDDLWERYAKEFADYSIYQTSAYQRVRAENEGQELSRAIALDDMGEVVMMCHLRVKHIKPIGLRVGYVQWGPLLRRKDKTVYCLEALQMLREAYIGHRVDILRLVPNIRDDETGKLVGQGIIKSGFERLSYYPPYRTFVLTIDDSHEQIRSRLHKSFRRDLKKAEGLGLEVTQGTGDEFCKVLEDLYLASIKRKGFKGLNPTEFTKAQVLLSTSEKMSFFVVSQDSEPVAMLLASALGDTSVVLLAAATEKGLACGASYIVWYQGAVAAHNAGLKTYDLGGIDPVNNPKVYQFKSRLGGQEMANIGVFEACSSRFKYYLWRVCEKAYNLVK
jgi:lipid II:glycine glycyltransferase (peptidoglycan interpeptide bridge formation enzyme)